jgi:hypothetical protein
MTNKIKIKMGPIEFEAEGDSELIERERAQFFSLLPQAITAVSPVVTRPIQLTDAVDIENGVCLPSENAPLLASVRQRSYSSVASFLNEKKFSTDVELVMGIGYYIECVERKDVFNSKDIESKLTEARKEKPRNISQALTQNVKKGYLREYSKKKDKLKAYSILDEGIKWCETYVASETDTKKKATRSKPTKPTPDSSLLAISLEELNLDNYCDVPKIGKFNEQMLIVMYIYTKEKSIEYFSFNDIVAVFKMKFKLQATDRKVRYAFDNGGTMFDKKVDKKVAYHKLMSSGIKEAERIIAQQKPDVVEAVS